MKSLVINEFDIGKTWQWKICKDDIVMLVGFENTEEEAFMIGIKNFKSFFDNYKKNRKVSEKSS